LYYQPEALQYVAPERFSYESSVFLVAGPSKESDVYSFAMASFSVRTSFENPSYYLIRSFRYSQVLTGALPYHGSNVENIIADIWTGKRPSHPIDASQDRWPQSRVWGVITTGWSHEPEKRCELSDMHRAFSTSAQWEQGDSNP